MGERTFPTVEIAEADLASALRVASCNPNSIAIKSIVADLPTRHYRGLMFASARKRRG